MDPFAKIVKTLRKIPLFHLISWCGNFVEKHSFLIVSGESPKTKRKLCPSAKFQHQEIRWNYGILHSESKKFLTIFTIYAGYGCKCVLKNILVNEIAAAIKVHVWWAATKWVMKVGGASWTPAKYLKVHSCKLSNTKYVITSTQIRNPEIFAFKAVLVFKLFSRKVLFINGKDNRNC